MCTDTPSSVPKVSPAFHATSHGKRGFADVTKALGLEMGKLCWIIQWPSGVERVFKVEEVGRREKVSEICYGRDTTLNVEEEATS